MPILTLTTDFGLDDYYVAAVKGVVLGLAPGATIVDVSHLVPPGDIERGGQLIAAAAPCFPPGTVHLAVVDPGVGSQRRILLAAAGGSFFLAPDNGLLEPILSGHPSLRSVTRSDLFRHGAGNSFHGRDRFAPIAAALLSGIAPESLGPTIDDPVRHDTVAPRRETSLLVGRIVRVDRYGNLITDLPAAWLPPAGWVANIAQYEVRRRASHYAEIPAGEAALLEGSLGTLEASLQGDDLARCWGVGRGTEVTIHLDR